MALLGSVALRFMRCLLQELNNVQLFERQHMRNGAFTRLRWNALRQRMAEEESGAWGSVDTRDVIVRLTGHQTNHATSKLLTLYAVAC